MARPNKFLKEDIVNSALKLVEEEGIDALTARALANRAGCSVYPIFSMFANMDDLKAQVVKRVQEIYAVFIEDGLKSEIAFKGVGLGYIKFAMAKPNFFKLLFMSDNGGLTITNVLKSIELKYPEILNSIMKNYSFTEEEAQWLYRHMWIYTHGIAVLCVTQTCDFSDEQINSMLSDVCVSLIINLKRKKQ